jgi:DNA-binding MarR family transcriptional regulator
MGISVSVADRRAIDYAHMKNRARRGQAPPAVDYETLAELRYQLRRFLRTRELAARASGVEPQQYQLLLQVKGLPDDHPATIGTLAERLQLRHHSVVGLVDRLVEQGMLARSRNQSDRREVVVELRPAGEGVLRKLALHSLAELRTEGPALALPIGKLIGQARRQNGRRGPAAKPRHDV